HWIPRHRPARVAVHTRVRGRTPAAPALRRRRRRAPSLRGRHRAGPAGTRTRARAPHLAGAAPDRPDRRPGGGGGLCCRTPRRRRTTDPATDHVLLGWSILQDLVGVTVAIVALIALGLEARSGLVAIELALIYAVIVVVATGLIPRFLRQLREEHDLFLIVSVA